MMLIVLLLLVWVADSYRWYTKAPLPEFGDDYDLWFDQQMVDHYDLQNKDTWSQRYFLNTTFYKAGSPMFIVCGGEGPESQASVNGHFIVNNYAQKYNALIVSVEARFYGKSVPTKDLSTASLKLLTTDQVLADFAVFAQWLKGKYQTGDIILFGGSYSGDLSAWLKMKYPQFFRGALATSAPTFASTDFTQYMEVVQNSINYFSPPCLTKIKTGMDTINGMLKTSEGKKQLETMFNTCDPMATDLDVATFVSSLTNPPCEIVQYNRDNIARLQNRTVDWMCGILNPVADPVQAYVALIQAYQGAECVDTNYQKQVAELKDTRPFPDNENAAARSWTYQTCAEFGWYQTTESDKQPFPKLITIDYYLQMCVDIFGINIKPEIDWINLNYGGYDPIAEDIFFPRGSIDPWHIECTDLDNPKIDTMMMVGAAHCADLYPPKTSGEIPDVAKARTHFEGLLKQWLGY